MNVKQKLMRRLCERHEVNVKVKQKVTTNMQMRAVRVNTKHELNKRVARCEMRVEVKQKVLGTVSVWR